MVHDSPVAEDGVVAADVAVAEGIGDRGLKVYFGHNLTKICDCAGGPQKSIGIVTRGSMSVVEATKSAVYRIQSDADHLAQESSDHRSCSAAPEASIRTQVQEVPQNTTETGYLFGPSQSALGRTCLAMLLAYVMELDCSSTQNADHQHCDSSVVL